MPKRKKIEESYNNLIPESKEKYFNKWVENPNELGVKMYSYFIHAEATSVIQIIICSNTLYNGIFHVTHFNFIDEEGKDDAFETIDFELLKESKDNSFKTLITAFPEIANKYEGQIVEDKILTTNPLEDLETTYLKLRMI